MDSHEYNQRRPTEFPCSAAYDLGYAVDRTTEPGERESEGRRLSDMSRLMDLSEYLTGERPTTEDRIDQEIRRSYRTGSRDGWDDHLANNKFWG